MNADGYIRKYRYSAPEVMPRSASSAHGTRKESDVYGMGMVVYEASSRCHILSNLRVRSHVNLQVLTGDAPYSKHTRRAALSRMRAGKIHQRPSHGIDDPVWGLLEKCWSEAPAKRPSATEVFDTLSQFHSLPPVPQSTSPEELHFEVVRRRIDEIAEVTQVDISPCGADRPFA